MEERRQVEKAMSIFELTIEKALNLSERVQTDVVMIYDRQANLREFSLLDSQIPADLHERIVSWLENNTDADDILWGMTRNRMDADQLRPLQCAEPRI